MSVHLCFSHVQVSKSFITLQSHVAYTVGTTAFFSVGHLHVQLELENGSPSAVLSSFTLPLHQWCLLNLELIGRTVRILAITYC